MNRIIIQAYTADVNFLPDVSHLQDEVLYFKSTIYNKEDQELLKDTTLIELWPRILENNFEYTGTMSELQIFKLTQHLIEKVNSDETEFTKWAALLQQSIPRMSITFATAAALQIISSIGIHIESCTTKTIIESIDFVCIQFLYKM